MQTILNTRSISERPPPSSRGSRKESDALPADDDHLSVRVVRLCFEWRPRTSATTHCSGDRCHLAQPLASARTLSGWDPLSRLRHTGWVRCGNDQPDDGCLHSDPPHELSLALSGVAPTSLADVCTMLLGPLTWLSGRYWLSLLLGALFAVPNYLRHCVNPYGLFSWVIVISLMIFSSNISKSY